MSAVTKPLMSAVGAIGTMMGNQPQQGPPHWQVDQFDVMGDTNVCLQTCFCFPCTESFLMTKREKGAVMMDPVYCCGAICFDAITRGFFASSLSLGLRRELVHRYGIQNEPYCSSVAYNICVPCNFCQIQREMAMRGEHPGGFCAKAPGQDNMNKQQFAMARGFGQAMATGNTWGSSLFDLAGAEDCIDGWCLACCTLAHMSNRVDAGRSAEVPADVENKMDPKTCVGAMCCLPQFSFAMRRELTQRYSIQEPHLVSFAYVAFCPCCSIAQTRREMGYRGEWPAGLLMKAAPPAPTRAL